VQAQHKAGEERIAALQSAFERQAAALRQQSSNAATTSANALASFLASVLATAATQGQQGQVPGSGTAASGKDALLAELPTLLQRLASLHTADDTSRNEEKQARSVALDIVHLLERSCGQRQDATWQAERNSLAAAAEAAQSALRTEREQWAHERKKLQSAADGSASDAARWREEQTRAPPAAQTSDLVRLPAAALGNLQELRTPMLAGAGNGLHMQ
jgi:hypothetical protein